MTDNTQQCAMCKQPTVTVHLLSLDASRRAWIICCLCIAELIGTLDRTGEPVAP